MKRNYILCPNCGGEVYRKDLMYQHNRHYTGIAGGYYATADEAIQANFDWLQQPVKEEHHEV